MLLFTLVSMYGSPPQPRTAPMVDEGLIARIAEGDTEAFSALYAETKSAVYGFALSILRNAPAAEDVMQDSYIRIYHAAKSYSPQGKPMAWILTIVRNLSLMKLRESRHFTSSVDEEWGLADSRDVIEDQLDRMVLEAALRLLSDEERQIVMLHSLSGMKFREIAELLGLPLSTVLSKHRRALSKLRTSLKEDGSHEG